MKKAFRTGMFASLFISSMSHAAQGWDIYPPTTVAQIGVEDDRYNIRFDNMALHACGSGTWRTILFTDPGAKEKYSLILSALASGKNVSIYVDNCQAVYEKIKYVSIHRQ